MKRRIKGGILMNVKRILGIIVLVVVAIGLFVFDTLPKNGDVAAATGSSTTEATQNVTNSDSLDGKKVLVVFFSRTKGLYGGDTPTIGNTHQVANYIQETTGGDTYEIVPAKEYPTNYKETLEVAKAEQANNERPAIKNPLPNVKDYDIVFVGSPIWWGEYPMIVRTFLDQVDLNGKVVIPFTTLEGSGLGNTKAQLEAQYPKANVLDGLAIRGGEASSTTAKEAVVNWLTKIGIMK